MANKKRRSQTQTEKKSLRIPKAKIWLQTYEGRKVVRAYRKKFHVDIACAARELQEIGYEFQDDVFYYIEGFTPNGVPYGITWEEMDDGTEAPDYELEEALSF